MQLDRPHRPSRCRCRAPHYPNSHLYSFDLAHHVGNCGIELGGAEVYLKGWKAHHLGGSWEDSSLLIGARTVKYDPVAADFEWQLHLHSETGHRDESVYKVSFEIIFVENADRIVRLDHSCASTTGSCDGQASTATRGESLGAALAYFHVRNADPAIDRLSVDLRGVSVGPVGVTSSMHCSFWTSGLNMECLAEAVLLFDDGLGELGRSHVFLTTGPTASQAISQEIPVTQTDHAGAQFRLCGQEYFLLSREGKPAPMWGIWSGAGDDEELCGRPGAGRFRGRWYCFLGSDFDPSWEFMTGRFTTVPFRAESQILAPRVQ